MAENTKSETKQEIKENAKICPFIIPTTCQFSNYRNMKDFTTNRIAPQDEIILYGWKTSNIQDLARQTLIKFPSVSVSTPLYFRIIYWDRSRFTYSFRDLGMYSKQSIKSNKLKSLGECRFVPGDRIDVSIGLPNNAMDSRPIPSASNNRRNSNFNPASNRSMPNRLNSNSARFNGRRRSNF